MTDIPVKISDLPAASPPLDETAIMPVVDSGVTKNVPPAFALPLAVGVAPALANTQAAATQLGYGFTVCDNSGGNGSLALPSAVPGGWVIIVNGKGNGGANLVFAKNGTTDVINRFINATAFDQQVAGGVTICCCTAAGAWQCNIPDD